MECHKITSVLNQTHKEKTTSWIANKYFDFYWFACIKCFHPIYNKILKKAYQYKTECFAKLRFYNAFLILNKKAAKILFPTSYLSISSY